jgi:hypothetical protein
VDKAEAIADLVLRSDGWCWSELPLSWYAVVPGRMRMGTFQDEEPLSKRICWRPGDAPASSSDRRHDRRPGNGHEKSR